VSFGNQVITFIARSDTGTAGELGTYAQGEVRTNAPGCRHRPLTFAETAELQFDIATENWKSTVPVGEYNVALRNAVLGTQPGDVLEVDGNRYQVVGGVRHHVDMEGAPFKATVISQKFIG
jgi:hypothetical protein